jgi:hypothetical protein
MGGDGTSRSWSRGCVYRSGEGHKRVPLRVVTGWRALLGEDFQHTGGGGERFFFLTFRGHIGGGKRVCLRDGQCVGRIIP